MGSPTVTITEFARNLSQYIHRVAFGNERFLLLKGGKPVAEVVPPPRGRRLGELKKTLDDLPHLRPEEAARFGEDLEAARTNLKADRGEDRWGS